MWKTIRLFVLFSLLAAEVALIYSLRARGWASTTSAILWLAAIGIAILPIIFAAIIVVRKGRRFSLLSLLLATGSLAGFIAFAILPILEAQRNRKAVFMLQATGAELKTETYVDQMYQYLEIPHDEHRFFNSASTEIPIWLQPLAGDVLDAPKDSEILEITVLSENQFQSLLRFPENLIRLETLIISGDIRPETIKRFADSIDRFPYLVNVHFGNLPIPEKCLSQLTQVRSLMIGTDSPIVSRLSLSSTLLSEIGRLPNLEILILAHCDVTDSNIAPLAPCHSLKHVTFWHTNISRAGKDQFAAAYPRCTIRTH
jgi:hypothetical protein